MKKAKNITAALFVIAAALIGGGILSTNASARHGSLLGSWPQHGLDANMGASDYISLNNAPGAGSQTANLLIKLNLTDAQKTEIAGILNKYRDALMGGITGMVEARKALFDAIHSGAFDESAVRNASRSVASTEEDLAVLRAQVSSEVKSVLSPDQIATLEQFKADILSNAQGRTVQIQSLIQAWIDKNS